MVNETSRRKVSGQADETAVSLLDLVRELACELHPSRAMIKPVTLDSSLDRDLGLDSLARMELLARIEKRFNATVPERVFIDAETVRDLLRAVLGAGSGGGTTPALEPARIEPGETQGSPYDAKTLIDVLTWHVQAHPNRPHIELYSEEAGGSRITYGELWEGARALAGGFQADGLQLGEPVALMLPTGKDYFFTFFGILLAGGIPVPLYPPVRRARMEDHLRRHRSILENCRASILITIPEGKQFARLLQSQVETLRSLATVEELFSKEAAYLEPALGARDVALLQYTSGSTGNPKGVVLTHANLLANIRAMGSAINVGSSDVFVSWLPLYHDMGLIGAWFGSLYYASLLVSMSPMEFIARPKRWLRAIHRWRATLSAAPNFAYEICANKLNEEDLSGLDLSSWRAAFNGAEPVSPATIESFCKRFGKYGFKRQSLMPVYGLAESSVGLAFPPLGRGPLIDRVKRDSLTHYGLATAADEADPKALSFVACGRPLAGHEIRIIDSAGRELPDRQEGLLQFRGPSSCSGYIHNPDQTRLLFDGDWLNTGDRAYMANGDIFITGRTKDIIIRAGRNIYPHELEEAIGNTPGIRKGSVAVFATKAPDSGTESMVVLAETRQNDPERQGELRARISELAVELFGTPPDDVVFVPPQTLLKTSSGKIRRSANRELYERGRLLKQPKAVWLQIMRLAVSGLLPELRRAIRALSEKLYALHCWIVLGLMSPFLWILVVLLWRESWRWSLLHRGASLFCRLCGIRLNVQGLENIPEDRACVLVANHASYIDSPVMIACLPHPVSFVAKAELAANPGVLLFLERIGTEFVERFDKQKGIEDARRLVGRVLSGRSLLFFPEGTFCRMSGVLPFHMGAFVAAADSGAPVVPIAIRGTRSILRADSLMPRRGSITVTIGSPVEPDKEAHGKADSWAIALRLSDACRKHILRHCGEPDLAHEKSPI